MRIQLLCDITNWLIGLNWNFTKAGTKYFALHFLCFHLCFFNYGEDF